MTKADQTAADRVLKAAVRRAITLARNGERQAVVALLTAAGTAAEVLLDGAVS